MDIEEILNWLGNNKEWLFSGIGIVFLVTCGNKIYMMCKVGIKYLCKKTKQEPSALQKFLSKKELNKQEIIHFSNTLVIDWCKKLNTLRISPNKNITQEILQDTIINMEPYSRAYLQALEHICFLGSYSDTLVVTMIEGLLKDVLSAPFGTSVHKEPFDFFLWKIFLSSIAMLLFYEKYEALGTVLHRKYLGKAHQRCFIEDGDYYPRFNSSQMFLNSTSPKNESGGSTELFFASEYPPAVTEDSLTSADVILCQISVILGKWEEFPTWYPETLPHFMDNNIIRDFWGKLKSKKECQRMLTIFGVADLHNLKRVIKENMMNEEMKIKVGHMSVPYIVEYITSIEDIASID